MAARYVARFALLVSLTTSLAFQAVPASASTCHNTVVVTDGGDSAGATPAQVRTALVDVCSGGTIRLRPGLVVLLAQGELIIPSGKVVTIISPRRQPATIDAQGVSRVLLVQASADLTLKNVIVQAGSPAGIQNDGSLTISGGQVTGNTGFGLVNMGGTVRLIDDAVIAANQGAGVSNGPDLDFLAPGQVTLEDESSIRGNVGTTGGGIDNGGLVILNDDSSIAGNEAQAGGGVYNAFGCCTGSLVLNDSSRITDNFAPFGAGVGGRGAVILNDDSAVVANRGEGVNNVRGDVVLNDNSSVADNEGFGVSVFGTGVTLNDHSSITGNKGPGVRCGDAFVILNGSVHIGENEAGGIRSSSCRVVLNGSSSVSRNTNAGDGGGGIENELGRVVLNDQSTISGNVARLGGGIYSVGVEETPATVTLNDTSAITGNVATGGQGGGIYNEAGTATLNDNSLITGNIPDDCYPATSC
jgi:hypothetical protein